GTVLHRARHRPGVIERPVEREHAGPAGATVGRLEAHDAAERGGPADGAAGVRPGGAGDEAGGQRRAGAAAGAAGDVVEVPRIARGLEAMTGELDPEREF